MQTCKKELHNRRYLQNFPDIKKHEMLKAIRKIGVQFINKEFSYRVLPVHFRKFSKHLFGPDLFLVVLQPINWEPATPVKREFLKFLVNLLYSNSNTDALSAILSILGTLTRNICCRVSFQYWSRWYITEHKLSERNSDWTARIA